ncbi:MAG: FHA domain-containing protein [Gammaproteobacteria bacterium]|nr:FHA domain-containing protein [Gammaproteobacteria bacterium]MCI0590860.1 FHA domain-containing protein [Gammaproteobacteria bacterium]
MAKLILSLNGVVQGEFALEKERTTVGRRPDNDIQIDNLAVSGKHALIITILDDSFLEDLGSTNGTYVNGKLIKKQALRNGDILTIGKHELKYINEHATADDEQFEKTLIIRPSSVSSAIAAAQAAKQAGVAPAPSTPPESKSQHNASIMPLGSLTVLNGPIAGKELELTKALITLGKPGVQVAVISRRPQGYFLTHIESDGDGQRYPLINGQPIGPRAYALRNSDVIELAGIKMEFSLNK